MEWTPFFDCRQTDAKSNENKWELVGKNDKVNHFKEIPFLSPAVLTVPKRSDEMRYHLNDNVFNRCSCLT